MSAFKDEDMLRSWDEKLAAGGMFRNGMEQSVHCALGEHFIKQYNPEQASGKRGADTYAAPPPPPPVCQPFNPEKFNFNKARANEILLYIKEQQGGGIEVCDETNENKHPIFVNVSPCTHGQFLLVPSPKQCLPQQMTQQALTLGLWLLAASDRPDLRLIFNSGGAWSSVNHLHLQGCYLKGLHDDGKFPIERLPRTTLAGGPVSISCLGSHALPTFVVGTPGRVDAALMPQLASVAMSAIAHMQKQDIAHNLMLTLDGGAAVFIFPRRKNDSMGNGGMNCAAFEVNGQVFCKNDEIYSKLTLSMYMDHLRTQLALDSVTLGSIQDMLQDAAYMVRIAEQLQSQVEELQCENSRLKGELGRA
jgi:hypothetical protein